MHGDSPSHLRRPNRGGASMDTPRYRENLGLDAAEVIEARHGLPTPIDPVP